MIKHCLSLIILIYNSGFGQSPDKLVSPGFYSSLQISKEEKSLLTTQVWGTIGNVYLEARYNYEDRRTVSAYAGRAFSFGKNIRVDVTPALGFVIGRDAGISLATNIEASYKKLNIFSENEYVSYQSFKENNFFFTWSGATVGLTKNIAIGIGSQLTFASGNESIINYGPLLRLQKSGFNLDGYAFNFWQDKKVWLIAIGFELPE